jgi:hypothetical protein
MLSILLGSMILALGVPEDKVDEVYKRFMSKYALDPVPTGSEPPSVIIEKIKKVI